jgi:hypothetical protein
MGVRDFIVRGLFVIDPIEIWGPVQAALGTLEVIIPYSLDRVRADFPEQRLYRLRKGASLNCILALTGHACSTRKSTAEPSVRLVPNRTRAWLICSGKIVLPQYSAGEVSSSISCAG